MLDARGSKGRKIMKNQPHSVIMRLALYGLYEVTLVEHVHNSVRVEHVFKKVVFVVMNSRAEPDNLGRRRNSAAGHVRCTAGLCADSCDSGCFILAGLTYSEGTNDALPDCTIVTVHSRKFTATLDNDSSFTTYGRPSLRIVEKNVS